MVRMSDLVRGPRAAPPAPPVEDEETTPPAPAAPPRAAVSVPPPPARLMLRTIGMEASTPATTAPPARPARARPSLDLSALGTAAAAPPSPRRTVPDTPQAIFDDLHVLLTEMRQCVRKGGAPSWPDVERMLARVVAALEESADLFWLANAPEVPAGADYLVAHQSRVAILAARIGLNVGYLPARAMTLGMAGAMIDIALWQSPESLLRGLENLSADEQAVYRAHPQRSAALLTQWGAPAPLVDAVLLHHEREQGQGFPRGLAGSAISQDAKILGLVDVYAGLTRPASRRPGLRPHEAIREVVRSKRASFSPALIKALLSEISAFPPGTLVRLNTGEIGQVTGVNRNHPLRPRVEVVADSKGNRPATPTTVDLSETPFLYIEGPVSP